MPIIHRQRTTRDFLFNAWLGHPLIMYCHHDDFAGGYGWLCDMATMINRLGDVAWQSLGEIARSNVLVRRDGTTLWVHPYSRHADVLIGAGTDHVVVQLPEAMGFVETTTATVGNTACHLHKEAGGFTSEAIPVGGQSKITVVLRDQNALDPSAVGTPPFSLRPLMRRIFTETRDRGAPVLPRLKSER
jgi:hypothetical protein